jgi:hypothetical protein
MIAAGVVACWARLCVANCAHQFALLLMISGKPFRLPYNITQVAQTNLDEEVGH